MATASWEDDVVVLGRDDVSDFNEDNILPLRAEELAPVRAWLQPTAYEGDGSEFTKHLTAHLDGTGGWLPETQAYRTWHDGGEKGLLWIRGIPGSGKSVHAATLIQSLRKEEGVTVLFFFFRQVIDANHQPTAALRDWLAQLLPYSPPLQLKLKQCVTERRSLSSVSSIELWQHLKGALRQIPKAYIVVDALDEMDRSEDADSFLERLAELANWRPAHTKVVATSRPVNHVETHLRGLYTVGVRLAEAFVDADIATYVHRRLSSSNIDAVNRGRINEAVPGRANGLFLYAKLAMDAFLQPKANAENVLDSLPQDLNVMYSDLLAQHAARSQVPDHIQILILQFVTHAARPLRLLELASMINVTQYPREERDLKAAKDMVRAACGPLLEILPDETVSVIHHSFTEFLTGVTREPTAEGYPVFQAGETHDRLALICLRHLQTEFWSDEGGAYEGGGHNAEDASRDALRQDTFKRYACTNWFVHARKAAHAGVDQSSLTRVLDQIFLTDKVRVIMALSDVNDDFRYCLENPERYTFTPVYCAIVLGLVHYAKVLISRPGTEVNLGCNSIESPLCCAAS